MNPGWLGAPIALLVPLTLVYLISRASLGRYEKLSRAFPQDQLTPFPRRWILTSPDFGGLEGLRNGMRFSAETDGLHLQLIWPLNRGRKPSFIPWSQISARKSKAYRFFNTVVLSFEGLPDVTVTLYPRDLKRIVSTFRGTLPQSLLALITA